jgi:acyl-[acyl carrier protein]--UDP-N-acetylglucosamine O-acyltransferase
MKLGNSFSGALRTFAYFMSSGTHYQLEGVNYLELYGEDPSAIETAYAIYANVIELDEKGNVINAKYAEKRAAQYIRSYFDRAYKVEPPFEDWETELHEPPPLKDIKS